MLEEIIKINSYQGGSTTLEVGLIFLRIFLSLIMGGLLGYEREIKHKPAGIRTISLVCVGATMIGILQTRLQMEGYVGDVTRMGAQVISGVGFIGGGAILQTKGSVQGLTTAATLWISACLGLIIGYGMLVFSILSFTCIFLILVIVKKMQEKYIHKKIVEKITVKFKEKERINEFLEKYSRENIFTENVSIKIVDMKWKNYKENELECKFLLLHGLLKKELIEELKDIGYIDII